LKEERILSDRGTSSQRLYCSSSLFYSRTDDQESCELSNQDFSDFWSREFSGRHLEWIVSGEGKVEFFGGREREEKCKKFFTKPLLLSLTISKFSKSRGKKLFLIDSWMDCKVACQGF